MEVGCAVGKVLAIDWRDKAREWVEFIRVRVLMDTMKPLRRVVNMVGQNGKELLCHLKYERLPIFCYICGKIGHSTIKCIQYSKEMSSKDY